MKLSDTNLSYAERALLERIVEPGEDIRWHGSPDALSFFKECMPIVLFSCFFVAIPLFIIIMSLHESGLENCDPMLLAPAFFILFGLSFPLLGLRYFKRNRQALYLLTNQRAILVLPNVFSGVKVHLYPIVEDMLRALKKKKDGSGDLVFDYSEVRVNDRPLPLGFLNIRNPDAPLAFLKEMGVKVSQHSFEL